MKVICIGHASYDITMPVLSYPVENTKNRVHDRVECGGGPASNAAYLLGKWGIDTCFIGLVGNDLYGKNIILEQYKTSNNTLVEEKREGKTVEDWNLNNLQIGQAIVGLPFKQPFVYKFDEYKR